MSTTRNTRVRPAVQQLLFVVASMKHDEQAFRLAVRDLVRREQKGIETYGEALHTHNGRDAIKDAYEEALDAVQYLTQALMEKVEDGGDPSAIRSTLTKQMDVALTLAKMYHAP